jgi:hypothetical protein
MKKARQQHRHQHRQGKSLLAMLRVLAPGFLALAFLLQNYVAERHFHPPSSLSNAGIHGTTGGDFLAKPFVPTSDQQDDDCPLCQVLGLAASTDLPHGIALLAPRDLDPVRIAFAIHQTRPVEFLQSGHSPRGPPSTFSA